MPPKASKDIPRPDVKAVTAQEKQDAASNQIGKDGKFTGLSEGIRLRIKWMTQDRWRGGGNQHRNAAGEKAVVSIIGGATLEELWQQGAEYREGVVRRAAKATENKAKKIAHIARMEAQRPVHEETVQLSLFYEAPDGDDDIRYGISYIGVERPARNRLYVDDESAYIRILAGDTEKLPRSQVERIIDASMATTSVRTSIAVNNDVVLKGVETLLNLAKEKGEGGLDAKTLQELKETVQTTIQRSMSANDVPVKRLAAIDDWTRNGKVKK